MPTTTHQPAPATSNPTSVGLLQRKCAGCKKDEEEKKRLGIQTKLKVSQPGDSLEREADRVAGQVLCDPAPVATNIEASISVPQIQRRPSAAAPSLNGESQSVIAQAGTGRPLPTDVRTDFESRFGHDFSGVKIHTDGDADRSAKEFRANAYTVSQHVVFGHGRFQPKSLAGRELLAHELTHVVQQSNRPEGIQRQARPGTQAQNQRSLLGPKRPPNMSCDVAPTSPAFPSITLQFDQDVSALTPDQEAEIAAEVMTWHASDVNAKVRVDGYASAEGGTDHNWHLSCERAMSVARELAYPNAEMEGIDDSLIQIYAHGETSEFGQTLRDNRLVVVSWLSPRISETPDRPKREVVGVVSEGSEFWVRDEPGKSPDNILGMLMLNRMKVRVHERRGESAGSLWFKVEFDSSDFEAVVDKYRNRLARDLAKPIHPRIQSQLPEVATRMTEDRKRRVREHELRVGANHNIGWIGENAFEVVATRWSDFLQQIEAFDNDHPRLPLRDKITRIRKMGQDKDLPYDEIIGAGTDVDQLRRQERPVVRGDDWQLLLEAKQVEMPDGMFVDMHHFLLGLDAIPRPHHNAQAPIDVFGVRIPERLKTLPVGENFAVVTWSGDVGSAAAAYAGRVAEDWEKDFESQSTGSEARDDVKRLDFYFRTRAPQADLLGDIDSWGAFDLIDDPKTVGPHRFWNVADLLRHVYGPEFLSDTEFKRHVKTVRAKGIRNLLLYYGFTSPRDLNEQVEGVAKIERQTDIVAGSWADRNSGLWPGDGVWESELKHGVKEMRIRFLTWLEELAKDNGVNLLSEQPQ